MLEKSPKNSNWVDGDGIPNKESDTDFPMVQFK